MVVCGGSLFVFTALNKTRRQRLYNACQGTPQPERPHTWASLLSICSAHDLQQVGVLSGRIHPFIRVLPHLLRREDDTALQSGEEPTPRV